jgi:hypothetical protein
MIGAGAVVTHDVPDYGLVYGNPARLHGFVCPCGEKAVVGAAPVDETTAADGAVTLICPQCGTAIAVPHSAYISIAGPGH